MNPLQISNSQGSTWSMKVSVLLAGKAKIKGMLIPWDVFQFLGILILHGHVYIQYDMVHAFENQVLNKFLFCCEQSGPNKNFKQRSPFCFEYKVVKC